MSINDKVFHWIRSDIRDIAAYHVPDPGDLIKLDAMENPYSWTEAMLDEWQGIVRDIPVNRYPDPAAKTLTTELRKAMGVPNNMGVMLGNGSDEIIQILALALGGAKRVVLTPEPSFVMYKMIATFSGMEYVGVPLKEDFSLDMAAMEQAIQQHDPAVIYLAYPNNPTGNLFGEKDIEAIIKMSDGLVVVDEAYHAFAGKSWMGRLGDYPNLLVMRTVSKLGLAGLRLGCLAGPTAWIEQLDKVRLPYNINTLTQVTAEFALAHIELFNEQTRAIREERENLMQQLLEIEGLTPYPSAANFILFRVDNGLSTTIFSGIKQRGVLIKNMGQSEGPLADTLRVTVSSSEENGRFVEALQQVLREMSEKSQ